MAKNPTQVRRKLIEFDAETWHGLDLLARETMKSLQELADEAFRDLLQKYGRPTDLKTALRESARSSTGVTEAPAREAQIAHERTAIEVAMAAGVRQELAPAIGPPRHWQARRCG